MQVLKDHCPLHFGMTAKRVLDANHISCPYADSVPMQEYYVFKRMFTFAPFTYCFQCCLPQSKNHNGEQPACHAEYVYKKKSPCPFAGFIFKAVFCIWYEQRFRTLLIQDLAVGATLATLDEFIAWAIEEHAEEGKYNNCLEAFLWFCGEIEKAKPDFFI